MTTNRKSAEEWLRQEWYDDNDPNAEGKINSNEDAIALIQRIITSERNAALEEAANICVNEEEMQPVTDSEKNTGKACYYAILALKDKQ